MNTLHRPWEILGKFEKLRKMDEGMSVGQLHVLLTVGQHELERSSTDAPMTMKTLAEKVDMTPASISRYVAQFTKLGLMTAYENPEYRREKFLELTKKGETLVKSIVGE